MWKLLHASVAGTSHALTGQPCQDYGGGRVVPLGGEQFLLAACADGAGSADHSAVGARLAVDTFLDRATGELARIAEVPAPPDVGIVGGWAHSARASILAEADLRGIAPRRMACTLLAVVAGPAWTVFLQVGDGVIVCDAGEGYRYAFWPDSGEYANTTRFLTDPGCAEHLRVDLLDKPVDEVALLTDGLQMLALDFAGRRVHGGFFRPMFETLHAARDVDALRDNLIGFLGSKRVNDRTDDDKTLLLATRKAP